MSIERDERERMLRRERERLTFVIGDRQQGKTTKLLEWARNAPKDVARVCVFATMDDAHRMQRQHAFDRDPNASLFSWQFISLRELMEPGPGFMAGVRQGHKSIEFGLDDIDHMLAQLISGLRIAGGEVRMITATGQNLTWEMP